MKVEIAMKTETTLTAPPRHIQMTTIAVLTDLTGGSEKPLRYAAALARSYGAKLIVAHACEPEFFLYAPVSLFPSGPPSDRETIAATDAARSLAAKLGLHDVGPDILVRHATIGNLLKELESRHPSLLVLATHGREGIEKWLAGSVAEEVYRRVPSPVLVLGPGVPEESALQADFSRILYGTDLSHISTSALQYAAALAEDYQAQLITIHVDSDQAKGFTFDRIMTLQRLQDWLRDHSAGLPAAALRSRFLVEFGDPGETIVKAATQWKTDIAVLGARGLGAAAGMASHWIGGTAYNVVCTSPCPVLVVPHV